jgi:Na+-driven multidrug efflux pump
MIETRTSIRISFWLGIFSAVAVFISNLALLDIWHGESDLTLEWRILHVSYGVFILFHISALITFVRLLGRKRSGTWQKQKEIPQ